MHKTKNLLILLHKLIVLKSYGKILIGEDIIFINDLNKIII